MARQEFLVIRYFEDIDNNLNSEQGCIKLSSSWWRRYAASQKVACSIPDVFEFLQFT
jgi:hypothetical protein